MNPSAPPKVCKLALEDGSVYTGRAFGYTDAPQPVPGEVVFNTSLTGYQEILTDPSYSGQIVTMTYPQIGNYGVNLQDMESTQVQVSGFIIKELARLPFNYRSEMRLEQWLAQQKVLGIEGIDTRSLVRKLRSDGAMRGVISCSELEDDKLVALAKASPAMAGQNLAQVVSPTDTSQWQEDLGTWRPLQGQIAPPSRPFHVVAIDCGAKSNILRHLADRGCRVTVVPHDCPAERILSLEPDGLFVSNGPGDPQPVDATINTLTEIRKQRATLPTFGICLGFQLLSLSLGARTYKLKFGHRGGNQPVQNLATRKVEITSQNHGFAVDIDSLRAIGAEPTHINLNDRTLEGFRHGRMPIFAVQYHPEASPGPHDSAYLFDCFMTMMQTGQSPTAEQMDAAQQARNAVGA